MKRYEKAAVYYKLITVLLKFDNQKEYNVMAITGAILDDNKGYPAIVAIRSCNLEEPARI